MGCAGTVAAGAANDEAEAVRRQAEAEESRAELQDKFADAKRLKEVRSLPCVSQFPKSKPCAHLAVLQNQTGSYPPPPPLDGADVWNVASAAAGSIPATDTGAQNQYVFVHIPCVASDL